MGLDFSKSAKTSSTPVSPAPAPAPQEELTVQPYDIVADRQQMNEELVNSPEVDALVSTIEIDNMESIVSFGAHAAEEISKASDVVLNSMNMSQLDESSQMLATLAKIMDKFDIEEIKEDPGFFSKLFSNMRKQLDKILQKYHTMGEEVDKINENLPYYKKIKKVKIRKEDFEKTTGKKIKRFVDSNKGESK